MPTIRTTLKLKTLRATDAGAHLEFEPYGPEFDRLDLPRLKRLWARGALAQTMLAANLIHMPAYFMVDYGHDGEISRVTWGE